MATAAEKWLNEQQRMKESAAASLRWNRDDDRRCFPVLVDETIQHVIWVEADDHEQAVERARWDTWEKLSNETRSCSWMDIKAPKSDWDWDRVYEDSGDGYQGLECNAHVEERRLWLAAFEHARLMATIADEVREDRLVEQRLACAVCERWREDGHDETARHKLEVLWPARRAAIDAQHAAKAVA